MLDTECILVDKLIQTQIVLKQMILLCSHDEEETRRKENTRKTKHTCSKVMNQNMFNSIS
jgi:hypothetical protein